MGSLFGGGKSTSTQQTSTGPWLPQQDYLREAFEAAQTAFQSAQNRPAYSGPMTAGLNDTQRQALQMGVDYANGAGGVLASQAAGVSGALMGAAPSFAANAGALALSGAGAANPTAQGVLAAAANGAPLSGPTAAAINGLGAQTAAFGTAQDLAARAQQDLNAALRGAAMGYVDQTRVQSQVDAATRDVARTLGESTLPGLNARAAAGGNLNSSRAGAAESVARRAAEDRAADLASGIRTEAFNTGLNAALAANQQQGALALGANQQAAAIGGALSGLGENQRQFDASTRLQGALTLGQQDLADRQLNASTRLSANAHLGQSAAMGLDAAHSAGILTDANTQRIAASGDAQQMEDQRQLDEAFNAYHRDENRTWDNLGRYYGIVGARSWGEEGTRTATTKEPSNVFGGIMGLASLAAGIPGVGSTLGALGGGAMKSLGLLGGNGGVKDLIGKPNGVLSMR